MTTKTLNKKMNDLVDLLVEDDENETRGYYAQIRYIPGFIVVASTVDKDNEPDLDIYTEATCLEWLKAIRKMQKENPDMDLWEVIGETRPTADY